ncbi:hypothetical protein Pflav_066410 [Phytohabitans flavus]|uniref:Uncharacterized protein n=1 Tax=Phytohabitans flavus TaxID=1076124 RepID=A0A6F8Y2N2_9ACTN|nr:hypothetical protein Pflav_066410 [Phytohabitans flavus]
MGITATVGPASPPESVVPTRATAVPTLAAGLTIDREGGFVGISQTITVEADGRWTYYRNRPGPGGGTPVRGKLNEVQLADLRALLADPRLGTEAGDPSGCEDGYEYTLVTGPTKVQWADCGTEAPATAKRVVELVSTSTPF